MQFLNYHKEAVMPEEYEEDEIYEVDEDSDDEEARDRASYLEYMRDHY